MDPTLPTPDAPESQISDIAPLPSFTAEEQELLALGQGFQRHELDNARKFVEWVMQTTRTLYCPDHDLWYCWDGTRYAPDPHQTAVYGLAETVVRSLGLLHPAMESDEVKRQLRWRDESCSVSGIRNCLTLAKPHLRIPLSDLDADPLSLNVKNGVLNLRDGQLYPHTTNHMCTKLAGVSFDPQAECPLWEQVIAQMSEHDDSWVKHLQCVLGYALTGLTDAQRFWLFIGGGANGKSTIMNVMTQLLGEYAATMDSTSLVKAQGPRGPREDLARLSGARMVTASEIGTGVTLDDAMVKRLTGGDAIAARMLYKNTFEFHPQFKLVLGVNSLPAVKALDHGMWRRACAIPFDFRVDPSNRDDKLVEKLMRESMGILNWLLVGLHRYQSEGWPDCERITTATDDWRMEMDTVGLWLESSDVELQPTAITPLSALYESYCQRTNTRHQVAKTEFSAALVARGYAKVRRSAGFVMRGIGLTEYRDVTAHISNSGARIPKN